MFEFSDYLINMVPVLLLEILAAVTGTFYLKKVTSDFGEKLIVIFLWFTVFIEILNSYSVIAYFSDYQIFGFIEHTVFRNNYWLGNIQLLFGNIVYVYFFSAKLRNKNLQKMLWVLTGIMVVAVLVDFYYQDFFATFSKVSSIFGSLLILLSILLFYLDLLASDKLLKLKFNLVFYISVALLIHTLCISPLDFLSNYFKTSTGNQLFVQFRVYTLFILNILLYVTYTIAFVICSRKKRLY